MALLWEALRHVMYVVLADRDAARNTALAARRAAVQAASEKADALAEAETQRGEMSHMNDLLNRRLLASKMEVEHMRARHADVSRSSGEGGRRGFIEAQFICKSGGAKPMRFGREGFTCSRA